MGDPRKIKSKVRKPSHPWIRSQIEEENKKVVEYGLKNKREIWRLAFEVKKITDQAKFLVSSKGSHAELQQKLLLDRLKRWGIACSSLDDVLVLKVGDLMDRRLQTRLVKTGLCRTMKQARQFVTHGHIIVNDVKITSPGYLVRVDDEIGFAPLSNLADESHAERVVKAEKKEVVDVKPKLVKPEEKKEVAKA